MKDASPATTRENASIVGSSLTGSKQDIENCTGPGITCAYIVSISFVFVANEMIHWVQLFLFFFFSQFWQVTAIVLYAITCNNIHFS